MYQLREVLSANLYLAPSIMKSVYMCTSLEDLYLILSMGDG